MVSCAFDATFVGIAAGVRSARECTGLAIGKPISCKIETIMWRSAEYQYRKNKVA